MLHELAIPGSSGYGVVLTLGVRSNVPIDKKKLGKAIGSLASKRLRRLSVGLGKGGIVEIERVEVKRVIDPSTTLGMFGL